MTATSPSQPIVHCRSLLKVYRVGDDDVLALQGLDLDVAHGEMVGIVGASGSGKSTLLSILGGLAAPTAGTVVVDGIDLVTCSSHHRDRYRHDVVGFVWQHSHDNLLADLSARENVERAVMSLGRRRARERAKALLDRVGLAMRLDHRPAVLSGGEQARVALAVALAHEPRLLLADEPTGELDAATTTDIFALMQELSHAEGVTQIVVSHDRDLVDHVDRVVGLRDGRTSTEATRVSGGVADTLVVDEVGRVQIPEHIVDTLGIGRRVTIDVRDGQAVIAPFGADDRDGEQSDRGDHDD